MSLKTFHLIFITASTLLALGCGILGLDHFFSGESGVSALLGGSFGLAAAVGLVFYERYFLKKFKKESYL